MFDQQREDPKGFYSSLAIIAGLVAIGAFMSGGRAGIVAIVAIVAAGVFAWLARKS